MITFLRVKDGEGNKRFKNLLNAWIELWCGFFFLCKLSFQSSQKLSPITNFPSVTFEFSFFPLPHPHLQTQCPFYFFTSITHSWGVNCQSLKWLETLAGSALKSKFIFYNSPFLKSYWFWYFSSFSIYGFYQVDVLQCTNYDNL